MMRKSSWLRVILDVGSCAGTESFFNHLSRSFLTQENYFSGRYKCANPPSGLDAIHRRQPDVQQNQIRFQFHRFLNRFESVRHFCNDLQFGPFRKGRADELPIGWEIFCDENTDCCGTQVEKMAFRS
jgi:hypothetical protein